MNEYAARNLLLRRFGYPTYADYLKSPLWKGIRKRVLRAARRRCARCGGRAWQVHHSDYEPWTLLGTRLDGLVALCRECHEGIEFDGKRKTGLGEANKRLGNRTKS